MSIRSSYPTDSPSLVLDFANSRRLDPRVTFTRAQTGNIASYMGPDGEVKYAGPDQPRFDHKYNSVTGEVESLGLLVEESRTNICSYSIDISNASWIKQGGHPYTSNDAIAPDGTNTATRFSRTANDQFIWFGPSHGAGTFTLSAWVKSVNPTGQFVMQSYNPTDGAFATTFTATNTWQRFSRTMTVTTASGFYPCIALTLGEDFYIWGVQIEAGAFPTSYIPTNGSTVTRAADEVSVVGENFSSWYNPSEGTIYADTRMNGIQTGRYDRLWAITNSNFQFEGISVFIAGPVQYSGAYTSSVTITNNATEQISGTLIENAFTTPELSSAFAFKQNDCASAYNGQQRFVDSIVDLSTFTTPLDRLLIGQPQRYQGYSCMTISQLTYYPTRLSNAQLQELTK